MIDLLTRHLWFDWFGIFIYIHILILNSASTLLVFVCLYYHYYDVIGSFVFVFDFLIFPLFMRFDILYF